MESKILSSQELRRYAPQMILPEIGFEGQEKLKKAKVLVIGAGGLGSPVLQYLAAAGVGNIGIIDNEMVDESNLQRQVLYGGKDVGKLKTIIARQRIQELNELINVQIINLRMNDENSQQIIKDFDLIVDATDNLESRCLINHACMVLNKPWIYGAIYKYEGQVSVFNFKEGPVYTDAFPVTAQEPESDTETNNPKGILGVLPGIVGTIQAAEAIKIITGAGTTLSGKILVLDILQPMTYIIEIQKNTRN
ncbi:MAG: HesA/MoeB/ThiF family protein [Bacteroidota bacterium]|nr:HesA/MoeB/ThiF family protein [Bacteroidota bacterium]MDP4225150.1 HesA/MoeB/ThiF family protein [Bacteroidota bacterium]MDP4273343.1 HesA/MoeB/ThiF family protein [Bacteroidota bacterium]